MENISRRSFFKAAVALGALPLIAQANQDSPKDKLKFIHITDSHMDLQVQQSIDAMNLMVSNINKEYKDLDFVLFGGDNFNNNAPKDTDALAFKKIIEKLHCPAYVVRGNKESSAKPKGDSVGLEDFKKLFFSKDLKVEGKDWLLETKGYQILGLDSALDNAGNGLYNDETLKFAQNTLKTGKPTIILNHHPYINFWGGTEKKDLHKYVLNNTDVVQEKLFSFDNLILTLSGHKHIDSVTMLNKTKVIATRGFIRPLDTNRYPMRYIEIEDSKINEKLIYTA